MQAASGLRFTGAAAGLTLAAAAYCLVHGLVIDDELPIPFGIAVVHWLLRSSKHQPKSQVEPILDVPTRRGILTARGRRLVALRSGAELPVGRQFGDKAAAFVTIARRSSQPD